MDPSYEDQKVELPNGNSGTVEADVCMQPAKQSIAHPDEVGTNEAIQLPSVRRTGEQDLCCTFDVMQNAIDVECLDQDEHADLDAARSDDQGGQPSFNEGENQQMDKCSERNTNSPRSGSIAEERSEHPHIHCVGLRSAHLAQFPASTPCWTEPLWTMSRR